VIELEKLKPLKNGFVLIFLTGDDESGPGGILARGYHLRRFARYFIRATYPFLGVSIVIVHGFFALLKEKYAHYQFYARFSCVKYINMHAIKNITWKNDIDSSS
jgi:hypothetical protein